MSVDQTPRVPRFATSDPRAQFSHRFSPSLDPAQKTLSLVEKKPRQNRIQRERNGSKETALLFVILIRGWIDSLPKVYM